MAGGLFGKPFVLNIKCIVFSLIIMSIFLYEPKIENNMILYPTLFIIFVVSYVAMAWYDYFYDCKSLPLKRGKLSLTGEFKPPIHSKDQINNNNNNNNNKHNVIIYASHILFIVPLLLYIVVYRNNVNKLTYPIVGVLAIFTLLYHGVSLVYNSH